MSKYLTKRFFINQAVTIKMSAQNATNNVMLGYTLIDPTRIRSCLVSFSLFIYPIILYMRQIWRNANNDHFLKGHVVIKERVFNFSMSLMLYGFFAFPILCDSMRIVSDSLKHCFLGEFDIYWVRKEFKVTKWGVEMVGA